MPRRSTSRSASSSSRSSGRSCRARGSTTTRTGFEASRRTCQTDRVSTTVDALELDALQPSAARSSVHPTPASTSTGGSGTARSTGARPLIARCAGVADVIAAVAVRARRAACRSRCAAAATASPGSRSRDDALVIDLSPMKGIRVDPEKRTARAQAGVLLGELDRETQAFGLAVPSGIVTHTGVAGLTLGGGIGWIMRKHGLSIDQLALGRPRHRRRRVRQGERGRERRALLGRARRRRQLRDRHRVRVPAACRSGRRSLAGPVFWPMEQTPARCCASTATGSPTRRTS